jgi:hypothetical protein
MMAIDRRGCSSPGLALLFLAPLAGCAQPARSCLPADYSASARYFDVNAPPGEHNVLDSALEAEILARFRSKEEACPADRPARTYRILALSGGGANGAFTVGVLCGWTAAGDRGQFDVVTGISTGGLIATYAFLGPSYDGKLYAMYTTVCSADIYHKRRKVALLWSESAATSEPLKRQIDAQIDCDVLRRVAAAHAAGRRLYIGTTNLDTRRLVVWDMGAIAGSGRPDALDLYRRVVLASASVPAFFPPVPIQVQINGRPYTELHADGSATSEVFLRGSMLDIDRKAVRAGNLPLAGSDVYIIKAGKLYADPECVQPRLRGIASSALDSLMAAQCRNDIGRIWTLSVLTGLRFHLTAIPQELLIPTNSLEFDPTQMRRLYEVGYRLASTGQAWRSTPPGLEESEQTVPRAGTEFIGPAAPQPRSAAPKMGGKAQPGVEP